jgi:hypothetical protein
MELTKVTLGEIPVYYGGPKGRPAVIVIQVSLNRAADGEHYDTWIFPKLVVRNFFTRNIVNSAVY